MDVVDENANEFFTALIAMRDLKKNVKALQDGLYEEQQQRANEVAELRQALENERTERMFHFQDTGNAIANETCQREAVTQRLRHDLGDFRMATEKEATDLRVRHKQLSESLAHEADQLSRRLEQLREDHTNSLQNLGSGLEEEQTTRSNAVDDLAARLAAEVAHARSEREQLFRDLAENTKVTQADHAFLGMVSDAFTTFKKIAMDESMMDTRSTAYCSPSTAGTMTSRSPDLMLNPWPHSPEPSRMSQ